ISVREVAQLVKGTVEGDADRQLTGAAPLDSAAPGDLSFVANSRYLGYLSTTQAGAVLVSRGARAKGARGATLIRVDDPHRALGLVLEAMFPEPKPEPGIHPTAVVDPMTEIAGGVSLGPYAVVASGCRIGADARIGAQVVIGERCLLGAGCVIYPQVTVYPGTVVGERTVIHAGARIGSDGFGYSFAGGEHRKIPQVGGCRVGAGVEIGANTTIDRGSIGDTVIGDGTKIDNLVHVGHNVVIGPRSVVVAQVGVSGSTRMGEGVVIGGQAGIGGHLEIGAGARIGAQSGVTSDVPPGETVSGYPARPHREALRAQAALFRLPELLKRLQMKAKSK
ncbi:MAG: UDP-3-O-(3-hydroxymyristoyl)glucosamine N-acyltransferase, partial [Longimicrobiaceae bacterium]